MFYQLSNMLPQIFRVSSTLTLTSKHWHVHKQNSEETTHWSYSGNLRYLNKRFVYLTIENLRRYIDIIALINLVRLLSSSGPLQSKSKTIGSLDSGLSIKKMQNKLADKENEETFTKILWLYAIQSIWGTFRSSCVTWDLLFSISSRIICFLLFRILSVVNVSGLIR